MKTDPCWKGYEMVGTKQKGKKTVPNCVQKKSAGRKQKIDGYLTQNKRTVRGRGRKGGFLPLLGLISSGINSAASAIKPLIPTAKPTTQTSTAKPFQRFRDDYNTTDKAPPPGSDMYAKFQRIMTDTNMSKENKDIELDNLIGSGMEFDDLMVGSGMALPGFGMTNFLKSGLSKTGNFTKTLGSALATGAVGTIGSLGVMELYKRWQEKKEEEKRRNEMSGGSKLSSKYNIKNPNFDANVNSFQNGIINDLNNKTKITSGRTSTSKPRKEDKVPLLTDTDDLDAIDFVSFENPQFKMPDFPTKKNKTKSSRAAKALAIGIPSAIGVASLGALIGTQANKKQNDEKKEEEEKDKYVNSNRQPTIMYGNGIEDDIFSFDDIDKRINRVQNDQVKNEIVQRATDSKKNFEIIKNNLDDVKKIGAQAILDTAQRGENLNQLVKKSADLNDFSKAYLNKTKQLNMSSMQKYGPAALGSAALLGGLGGLYLVHRRQKKKREGRGFNIPY